jgi:hypothetical protein
MIPFDLRYFSDSSSVATGSAGAAETGGVASPATSVSVVVSSDALSVSVSSVANAGNAIVNAAKNAKIIVILRMGVPSYLGGRNLEEPAARVGDSSHMQMPLGLTHSWGVRPAEKMDDYFAIGSVHIGLLAHEAVEPDRAKDPKAERSRQLGVAVLLQPDRAAAFVGVGWIERGLRELLLDVRADRRLIGDRAEREVSTPRAWVAVEGVESELFSAD